MSHSDLYAEVDRSAYTNALAKCSPVTKAFFAVSTLFIVVSSPTFIVPIAMFLVCTVLVLGLARVRAHLYIDMLIYPTFTLILSCIFLALFFGSGEPLTEIALPWTTWTIYRSGITMSINTFFRVEGALSCLFFLVLTTSITDLCFLLRKIRVPKVLIEISLLVYRYIFVFLEVLAKMNTAQKLRLGYSGWLRRIRSLALLAGTLFIMTLEQAERTFIAMSARGYDGTIHVLEDLPKPNKAMLAAILLFEIFLVIVIFLTINVGVLW